MKTTLISIIFFLEYFAVAAYVSPRPRRSLVSKHNLPAKRAVTKTDSYNWSGGLVYSNKTFNYVSAEMIVPNITFPEGGYNSSINYESSVWIGFSGYENFYTDSTPRGLWQTGFYYLFDTYGDFGVYPFYEWYPDGPLFWDTQGNDLLLKVGHKIRMTLEISSDSNGTAVFENLSSGKVGTATMGAPVNGTLDSRMAEWVVEEFIGGDPGVVYPNYGVMKWSKMVAKTTDGKTASLKDAYYMNAAGSGKEVSDCSIHPPSSMSCAWEG
jgi:hypothetical protein